MAGLRILRIVWVVPLNFITSRYSTAHTDAAILGVGHWINILPFTRSNAALREQEFWDNVLLWCQVWPTDLPDKCDGCANNKPFTLQHMIHCKVGGMVMGCHNEVHDLISVMRTQAFYSYSIRNKPIISTSRGGTGTHSHRHQADRITGQMNNIIVNVTSNHVEGLQGDLHIHHMWQRQTENIIDVRVTDTYVKSCLSRPLDNVMETKEKEKKKIPPSLPGPTKKLHPLRRFSRQITWARRKMLLKKIGDSR